MVKTPKGSIVGYSAGPVPTNPADIPRYLDEELGRIAGVFAALLAPALSLRLAPASAAPETPVMGMVIYTEGTSWNPGSGEGYYYYNRDGVWSPLG